MTLLSQCLFTDITNAKMLFIQKRDHFRGLSAIYSDRVTIWNQEDRQRRFLNKKKEIECVYRHNPGKVPSQAAIYQFLLGTEDAAERSISGKLPPLGHGSAPAQISEITGAAFLNEALYIQSLQRKIASLANKQQAHPSKAEENEIIDRRKKLSSRIDKWRSIQAKFTPQVADDVARQSISGTTAEQPEKVILFIPSDYGDAAGAVDMIFLEQMERQLREGAAFDAIRAVQNTVKIIGALESDKKKNTFGQVSTTRARAKITDAEFRRDLAISSYNASRAAMIALGLSKDDTNFPLLSLHDTFRRPTHLKRGVGDSRSSDGRIWTTGVNGGRRDPAPSSQILDSQTGEADVAELPLVGTQGSSRKKKESKEGYSCKGKKRHLKEPALPADVTDLPTAPAPLDDGWIWRLGTMGNLSEKELREWADEGDRVQWFRAEAEMQRWQEEWERKQVEFMCCIRGFSKMSDVWAELSKSSPSEGHASYVRKKSVMFSRMGQVAQAKFNSAGYTNRVLGEGKILADLLQEDRHKMEGQDLPCSGEESATASSPPSSLLSPSSSLLSSSSSPPSSSSLPSLL